MNELKWEAHYDANFNENWEAKVIREDNVYFYRIYPMLKNNKIMYIEDSSQELWIDPQSPYREEWLHLEDAKYDMFREYKLNLSKTL